jgi:hypothetical protein
MKYIWQPCGMQFVNIGHKYNRLTNKIGHKFFFFFFLFCPPTLGGQGVHQGYDITLGQHSHVNLASPVSRALRI